MGILSYMKPKGKTAAKGAHAEAEMTEKSSVSEHAVPGSGSATPFASRPVSLYPVGDFRNSQADEINEIKCDVMVNWLYQQQMERLWTAGGRDEGVMLKKGRSTYASCPADIADEPYGFFKAIETLNVRVSHTAIGVENELRLTCADCNDRQHQSDQAFLAQQRQALRPSSQRPSSTGPTRHIIPPSLPKTSVRSIHCRSRHLGRLG